MLITQKVGITSYGVCLPQQAVATSLIEKNQPNLKGKSSCLGIKQKTVPDLDEDSATLGVTALSQALLRWQDDTAGLGCLFVGSESHPYAVKPTGTVIARALNLPETMAMADLQFACKAGSQAIQIGVSYVLSGLAKQAVAIGSDTAQSTPGDVLELTAAAGAAAFILGPDQLIAQLRATISIATDTPDFWRRHGQHHPQHAGRFSGEPGYYYHIMSAANKLLSELNLKPSDIDHCIFHTPNQKFPILVAKKMGFSHQQLEAGLVVSLIGNTYAAASLIGLSAVLDVAEANQKILMVSYGSGSGADAFLWQTTGELIKVRNNWHDLVRQQINHLKLIDYSQYLKLKNRS